jgi:ATP-dependent Clp protease ATP-binding subunit ClpA
MWTGIPSERIRAGEMQRLAGLADDLKKKIIGQDEAVQQLAAAVRRSRLRLSPRRRPASFIFVGPTGVGKTELVKVLSKELFDTPETLIRLDMSEYMEKHSVSKIIGSPPGYVGYDEAGQVTEKVRRQPYSVLLFDEIEKAHPDVLNILLQILDEGRITDAQGRTVNFENTVIVMTSNAGSDRTENIMGFGQTVEDAAREKAMKALREFLRPEFLSRVDEVIVFRTLTQEDYARIAALTLDEYVDALKEQSITFMYDTAATEAIAAATHGGRSGARDIRIHIRRKVEDPLAEMIVQQGEGTVTGVKLTTDEQGELLLLTL